MKINFTSMIVTTGLSAMIFVSCQSHEQKADDAFEQVREEKMLTKDSDAKRIEIITDPKATELTTKNIRISPEPVQEKMDEWSKFKAETEKKIHQNEIKIKQIKGTPDSDFKIFKKAAALEKDNNDLRRQMNEYNEEMKVRWENFRTKIDHDVDQIGVELKDMSGSNSK